MYNNKYLYNNYNNNHKRYMLTFLLFNSENRQTYKIKKMEDRSYTLEPNNNIKKKKQKKNEINLMIRIKLNE